MKRTSFANCLQSIGKRVSDILLPVVLVITFYGCSPTKFLPEDSLLLDRVKIRTEGNDVSAQAFSPYVRQKANSRWFSIVRIPLRTYSLAGRDSSSWFNRMLHRIGQPPVVYDSMAMHESQADMLSALHNMGYLRGYVTTQCDTIGRKLRLTYRIHPLRQSVIGRMHIESADSTIGTLISRHAEVTKLLPAGSPFTVSSLDNARKLVTRILMDNGYYHFHKDYIYFDADSLVRRDTIDITMHITGYRPTGQDTLQPHPRYYVASVKFIPANNKQLSLRRRVLENNTVIESGNVFSAFDLEKTYQNFSRLQAVRYTNIRFTEHPDTALLDCAVTISTNKPSTISLQPEGTNTAGDLGAAASLTYENRNLFHGSEVLTIGLRGAFEAITGLEGYQNQDYEEYNAEMKLNFPRFVAPFLTRKFIRKSSATSEMVLSWNMQNRPEFHRRVFTTAWRYRWSVPRDKMSYRFDLFDLNYVYMPWISATFKRDYLDNDNSRNAILRYNYEDLFIMKMGFGLTYNGEDNVIRANVESAGNFLHLASRLLHAQTNDAGKYSLFKIAYAQYIKGDFDISRLIRFDENNALALHLGFGIAYPYGNSTILPFEKRYFAGGANSVRGWSVRGLGPGRFRGSDGRIDFINQTGDMKIDLNAELRTFLFWKLHGAFFIDAGNIWTLRAYEEQPGGQFEFDKALQDLAVAYGLGLRLNLDYFLIRFDMGMKAVNPAFTSAKEHLPIIHPKLSRDFAFHFAVGLPF